MIRRIPLLVFFLLALLTAQAQTKVVGYVPNWGSWPGISSSIQWSKVTHVHVAFYNPPSTSSSVIAGDVGLTSFVTTAHTNNVKVLASLGGANGDAAVWNFWLSSAANRTTFVNNLVSFVNTYNLDGLDVDMEGAAVNGNYQAFVVELGTALHGNNKLMSCAIAPWFGTNITATALAQYDYIGLMSYDATGSWATCTPGDHAPFSLVLSDIAYWRAKGVPNNKMVIGLPFYGYYFGNINGSVTFGNLVAGHPGAQWVDSKTYTSGSAVFYNGIPTIKLKTRYALERGFGGVMIWELSQDATGANSLLSAIDEVVQGYAASTHPTVSITAPAAGTATEGQSVTITADVVATTSVLKVEFFADQIKLGEDISAPYSYTWTPDKGTYNYTATVVDNLGGMDTSSAVNVTYTGIPSAPYLSAFAIPGTIQAEHFNFGGQGVAFNDVTTANSGNDFRPTPVDMEVCVDGGAGYAIGWTAAGEWLTYDVNVANAGVYDIILRTATTTGGRTLSIEMDGTNITGTVTAPVTAGWGCYQNILVTGVSLTAGQKVMKVNFINGNANLNYVRFTLVTPVIGKQYANMDAYLYPNPSASPSVHASGLSGEEVEVIVSDPSGRILMQYNTTAASDDLQLPANELESGLYIVRLISGDRAASMTWMK